MRLDSVRDLKGQLARDTLPPMLESAAVRARAADGPNGARRRGAAPIALGVAKGKHSGDYKLAVRIQQGDRINARAAAGIPQRINDLAQGEADIRIVRNIKKRARRPTPWYQGMLRPLTIGSSVGHHRVTCGTLGAFVRCGESGDICMLSNNHVLANEGQCRKGDVVLQQGSLDGGVMPDNRVARLERWTRFSTRGKHLVDAAIAVLDDEMEYYATTMRGRPQTDLAGVRRRILEPDDIVWKVGRTTGFTKGVVTAIELDDVVVEYDMGDVTFDDQIEIAGVRGTLFCDGGDSGSLIVDADDKACALLFAGGYEPGRGDLTYAHPIKTVFEHLDVTLAR